MRTNGFRTARQLKGWSLSFLVERVQAHYPQHATEEITAWDEGLAVVPDEVAERFGALWNFPPKFLTQRFDGPPLQWGDLHVKTTFQIFCDEPDHTDYSEHYESEEEARSAGWLSEGEDRDVCPHCIRRREWVRLAEEARRNAPPCPMFDPNKLGLGPEWGGGDD